MKERNKKVPVRKDELVINVSSFLIPLSIVISGVLIGGAVLLTNGKNTGGANTVDTLGNDTAQEAPVGSELAQTTIDDDPYLGNKESAKIAIVEFSDYECPFCEKFYSETLGEIKKNYIDTGKAIFVYRDFPLGFHDPAATLEARAAECARALSKNDTKYFEYHDLIFQNTPGNGTGLSKEKLGQMAVQVGVPGADFNTCLDSDQFEDEVAKDIADGSQAGVSGTPGFVVGKLTSDGKVDGVLLAGAYPYAEFKRVIEEQLSK